MRNIIASEPSDGTFKLRGSRTASGRAKGLEENQAGPSGGGGGERGIFKHRGQGQARWAFMIRAWGSGGVTRSYTVIL